MGATLPHDSATAAGRALAAQAAFCLEGGYRPLHGGAGDAQAVDWGKPLVVIITITIIVVVIVMLRHPRISARLPLAPQTGILAGRRLPALLPQATPVCCLKAARVAALMAAFLLC